MATLRKDGRYQAKVKIGETDSGKRIMKFFYGDTEAEAESRANEYFKKYIIGNMEETPFQEYAQEYIAQRIHELAPATVDSYSGVLERHVFPTFRKTRLADITQKELRAFFLKLEDQRVGPRTRSLAFVVLSLIFKQAAEEEMVEVNPMLSLRKPKYQKKESSAIPLDDFQKILSIADPRMTMILRLAWATGMRVGEIAALQWGDVSLAQKTITVRRSISKTSDGLILKSPKTSYGRRTLPVPKKLLQDLLSMESKGLFIFPNSYGAMQSPDVISKTFSKLCRQAGVSYRFHQIRHTHATMLADEGVSPKAIQERLGHHSAAFSLDVYTHATEQSQKGIGELKILENV